LYTRDEDRLILDYIAAKRRYDEVRGKRLWVDIADSVLRR